MLVHHDQQTERWRHHPAVGQVLYAVGYGDRHQLGETGCRGAVYPLVTRAWCRAIIGRDDLWQGDLDVPSAVPKLEQERLADGEMQDLPLIGTRDNPGPHWCG